MKTRFSLTGARVRKVWFVQSDEGAIMGIFKSKDNASDFVNNKYFGYYKGCSISSTADNYEYWIKKAQ